MHKLEGYYYAVKKIKLEVPKNFDIKRLDIFTEIATMVNLQHKNIVRFITSWMEENVEDNDEETLLNSQSDLSIHFGNTQVLKDQKKEEQ